MGSNAWKISGLFFQTLKPFMGEGSALLPFASLTSFGEYQKHFRYTQVEAS